MAPPPVAITAGCGLPHRAHRRGSAVISSIRSRSSLRKCVSPLSLNMMEIGSPARCSSSASQSTRGHPRRLASARETTLFPVAIKPVRMTLGAIAPRRAGLKVANLFEIAAVVARDFHERVAGEFFEEGVGEFEGNRILGDHGGGRNRAYVGAFDRAGRLGFGLDVG